jgi:glutathione S-transferase
MAHHRREGDAVQAATIAWASGKTRAWLSILDTHMIGNKSFLCSETPTIADYFGAPVLTLLDLIQSDYSKYPNVRRWLSNVKALPSWSKVNEAFHGWATSVQAQRFVGL